MQISKLSKEELETYSYDDLARMIIEDEKRSFTIKELFKKICDLLGMSDEDFANKIGDFYTTLTTDKDFVMLDDGKWDLRERQGGVVEFDDDEDDEELDEDTEIDDDEADDLDDGDEDEGNLDDTEADIDEDLDDIEDNDDLTIVDEEDLDL